MYFVIPFVLSLVRYFLRSAMITLFGSLVSLFSYFLIYFVSSLCCSFCMYVVISLFICLLMHLAMSLVFSDFCMSLFLYIVIPWIRYLVRSFFRSSGRYPFLYVVRSVFRA